MKRIKLLSTSKELPLKCWYSLSDSKKLATISDLKKQLVADLSLPCKPDEFMLEMDDYELLKGSKIEGVLRDNDTLSVRLVGKKRKASIVAEEKEAPLLKKKKTAHTEKLKDKPKKVVKTSKHKATDKKDTSKKHVKKSSKKADKKELKQAELKKKKEEEEKKKKKERELNKKKKKKEEKKEQELKKKAKKKEEKAKDKVKKKGKPVQVKILTRTQNRNLRRKMLKEKRRESKNNSQQPEDDENKQQEEPINDEVDLTVEEQQYDNEMVDYNPYGRALVTSIECAPNFKPRNKNKNRNFTPREYPVHRVPQLFYAQHHVESYSEPHDSTMQNGDNQEEFQDELNNNNKDTQSIDDEEEEKDKDVNMDQVEEEKEEGSEDDSEDDSEESEDDSEESEDDSEEDDEQEEGAKDQDGQKDEEENQATTTATKPVDIDYDTLAVLNFNDNPPQPNDRLAIKILELTSTYTPEISGWKHVLLKQIDSQTEAVVVEFEKGFGKASTKGGKFDIRKKKKRNNWHRGRRYVDYDQEEQEEQDEEEQTDEQDKEEEEEEDMTATYLMSNIFEMRKLD